MIAGLFLKGNEVRIVSLNGTREQHELVADKLNKIAIPKAPTQADIAIFCETLLAYCERHAIEQIVVNRRATTGQGAGGAGTFILEGVMLAVVKVPLSFVHPATLRASDKKYSDLKLAKPTTVDLGKAYDLAFEALT
ncbi:DUF3010 family protein [Shewanella colwelliana]|uniref:DUF3010 family protein n=1 Tax=Shewanella colwelliana TaxID=23 RepID=UPI0004912AFD|nr:DUF3010 family protein [Shewanella colwelliana]MCZ4339000.1 DUF3010 family protein [Shewanella colwelliana]MDX1283235.1 DUF3010 family protein [Shewanella colwelliana]